MRFFLKEDAPDIDAHNGQTRRLCAVAKKTITRARLGPAPDSHRPAGRSARSPQCRQFMPKPVGVDGGRCGKAGETGKRQPEHLPQIVAGNSPTIHAEDHDRRGGRFAGLDQATMPPGSYSGIATRRSTMRREMRRKSPAWTRNFDLGEVSQKHLNTCAVISLTRLSLSHGRRPRSNIRHRSPHPSLRVVSPQQFGRFR